MIRAITVTNYAGDELVLELARPDKSGFAVTSITGLGPGKAKINTTEVSTNDGSLFNSSRLPERNIVISLKYLWNNTVEDTRQLTYKFFPIKKKLKLLFETDNRKAEIEGYVEENNPNIFNKQEGSDISIICPNPFFYSADADGFAKTQFSAVERNFEFPFSNESLSQRLLEMSIVRLYAERNISYNGDADVGVTITLHAVGAVSGIGLYNRGTGEKMLIDTDKIKSLTGSGVVTGDDIVITTTKGNKSITLIRAGKSTNILGCLDKDADWFQLSKGDNKFAYVCTSGALNLQVTIENQVVFEGV